MKICDLTVPTYPGCIVLRINFYGSEIQRWDFWGVKFWSRDFGSLEIFWGFDFCPHSIIPVA